MNRKSKLLIGAVIVAVLGVGTTFAIAQYRVGFHGHGGMSDGMGFRLGLFCSVATVRISTACLSALRTV
jgi:hypothetical protein